jgi:hypothetical protein
MTVTDAARPSGQNVLSGHVLQATYSGASVTYRIRVGALGETPLLVFAQNRSGRFHQPGDPVTVAWDPAHTIPVNP